MQRPELDIKLKPRDWLVELLIFLIVVITWFAGGMAHHKLSLHVPLLKNGKHVMPGPSFPVGLAVISTFMYMFLSVISLAYEGFKYPVIITPDNAEKEYRWALHFLRIAKLTICAAFMLFVILLAS